MKALVRFGTTAALFCLAGAAAGQAPAGVGTEEFGKTAKQLVEAIDKVESQISKCMREKGFEYIAADYNTVRRGMNADKKMPGMSEKEFFAKFGFGTATTYTGEPPQLAEGYSPGKEGLGERNIQIFKKLPAADQVAYNRALFGRHGIQTRGDGGHLLQPQGRAHQQGPADEGGDSPVRRRNAQGGVRLFASRRP
jgi:hypothetical protein